LLLKLDLSLVDDILPKEITFDANVASPVFAIVKASLPLYFKVIFEPSIMVCINYLFYHKIVMMIFIYISNLKLIPLDGDALMTRFCETCC
jgi:hypothetical protein